MVVACILNNIEKADEEKGSMWTEFGHGLGDPKYYLKRNKKYFFKYERVKSYYSFSTSYNGDKKK